MISYGLSFHILLFAIQNIVSEESEMWALPSLPAFNGLPNQVIYGLYTSFLCFIRIMVIVMI